MDKLFFNQGELKHFITQVESKLGKNSEELSKLIGISGRTLRGWRGEKFKPPKDKILKLSQLSGIKIPPHQVLPQYWHIKKAARLGGMKTFELYGLLGNRETRSKGGKVSWRRRKDNPEVWKKYTKTFNRPEDSSELAELIGILLGDGGITNFQCAIYLNSDTDQEFAYYVKELMCKLFGVMPSIYKAKEDRVWRVSVSGVNLIKYLKSKGLILGNKVHLQVGVPNWIWSNQEFIKGCLRGLIDTDGCFVIHKYKIGNKQYSYPKINFTNRSMPLLDFVEEALKHLGFTPKRSFKYQIWLHRHLEVLSYLEEVGTRNYKPAVKKILEGGPDGKAMVC